MASLWLVSVLLVLQPVMFILGALTYHGIRMLSVRPMFGPNAKPQLSEAQIQAVADKAMRQQVKGVFSHLGMMPDMPTRQVVPEGDGRPKGEAFAPVVTK